MNPADPRPLVSALRAEADSLHEWDFNTAGTVQLLRMAADRIEALAAVEPAPMGTRHGWNVVRAVECVMCPVCTFTFAAIHENETTGGYTCPNCSPSAEGSVTGTERGADPMETSALIAVLDWLCKRPGASWIATIQDIMRVADALDIDLPFKWDERSRQFVRIAEPECDHGIPKSSCGNCSGRAAAAEQPRTVGPNGRSHELKTDPNVFQAVLDGRKTWEIRRDDRGFREGDLLVLRETVHSGNEMLHGSPLVYTGREYRTRVAYILRGPAYGLADEWAIMSIRTAEPETNYWKCECGERFYSYFNFMNHDCPRIAAAPEGSRDGIISENESYSPVDEGSPVASESGNCPHRFHEIYTGNRATHRCPLCDAPGSHPAEDAAVAEPRTVGQSPGEEAYAVERDRIAKLIVLAMRQTGGEWEVARRAADDILEMLAAPEGSSSQRVELEGLPFTWPATDIDGRPLEDYCLVRLSHVERVNTALAALRTVAQPAPTREQPTAWQASSDEVAQAQLFKSKTDAESWLRSLGGGNLTALYAGPEPDDTGARVALYGESAGTQGETR